MGRRGSLCFWWLVLGVAVCVGVRGRTLAAVIGRVSVDSNGNEADGGSGEPAISADGRFVAFESWATNLVPDDTNSERDVFVHDRQTGQTTRVSVDSSGAQANGDSGDPAISADGRFVAFESWASNLVPGDTNGQGDVFVHDRQTGETTRVSVSSGGAQGNDDSTTPAISADGRFVAFLSSATNLVPGDTNSEQDVFVHDRQTGQTTRVSVDSTGAQQTYGFSGVCVAISADGRFVAFLSSAANLVAGDTNGCWDVFVHDRQTGQTTRVSVSSSGAQGNADSGLLQHFGGGMDLSGNGRFVVFGSDATNLVPGDTNSEQDIFVHDRQTGQTTRVSVDSSGAQANGQCGAPRITHDGRFVTFWSKAALAPNDTNDAADVYMHDRQTRQTTRVSAPPPGLEAIGSSLASAISAEGRFVAFESYAWLFGIPDTNEEWDVYLAEPTWAPVVAWVGAGGFKTDGVDPDAGAPVTLFTYKVKYRHAFGEDPQVARCDIYRNDCGEWKVFKKLKLTRESGTVHNGAVFAGSTTLPRGYPYAYRFVFRSAGGLWLKWPKKGTRYGPSVTGAPRLCWTAWGDGVSPNSGAAGDKYLFKVLYLDSAGEAPTLSELQVRRNGKIRYKRAMKVQDSSPNYREGAVFQYRLEIAEAGSYEYRFQFRNSTKDALGDPTSWHPGPTVGDGGSALVLTSLTAVPTAVGAEVRFSLTSAASVTAEVLNVAGRPVKRIVADRPLEAGMQTLLWDGRADTGLTAPAGLYLVRVTARTADGGQSSAVATVRVR